MPCLLFCLLWHLVCCQDYEYQEEQAQEQLTGLNKQFEATVADILGIAAEQQASQLAQAVLEQQQLQEAEVRANRPY